MTPRLTKILQLAMDLVRNAALYPVSLIWPRSPHVWAFGAPKNSFSDNAKYFYLWAHHNIPDIRSVWITGDKRLVHDLKDRGYRAAYRWSVEGMFFALRAGIIIYSAYASDVNVALTGGARWMNLWHGIGPKKLEWESTRGPRGAIFRNSWNPFVRLAFLHRFRKPDYFLSTTDFVAENYARSFRMKTDAFLRLGTPRLDLSFDEALYTLSREFDDFQFFDEIKLSGRRVIVYMPTWRDTDRPFLNAAFPDLAQLSAALDTASAVLLIKTHINTADRLDLRQFENILIWPPGPDIYPVLSQIDCMITDYSSVLYDYLLIKTNGITIYDFDNSEYFSTDRDMFVPFEECIAGVRVKNFGELCARIADDTVFSAAEPSARQRLLDMFWGEAVPPVCPRLANFIKANV